MVANNKGGHLLNADLRGAIIHLAKSGKDVSNKAIIEKTGLKKSAVSGYLSGKASASPAFIKKFEEVYGIKIAGCGKYLPQEIATAQTDEYKDKYLKLLEENKVNSDALSTAIEAIEGLLRETYLEVKKQRELSEQMLAVSKGTLKV